MGFSIFMIFTIFISILLVVIYLISAKVVFGKILLGFWLFVISLFVISSATNFIFKKKLLTKDDYYGEYVIDRNYFKGKQADWQYEHFRFEITEDDKIYFYVTDNDRIIKTYTGSISTVKPYSSERLVIHMDEPVHHIMAYNPTIYRSTWDFYMVFYSYEYNNMFFRKGEWEKIE